MHSRLSTRAVLIAGSRDISNLFLLGLLALSWTGSGATAHPHARC